MDFDYLVYALGSHLPAPINIWSPSRSIGPGVSFPHRTELSEFHLVFQTPNPSQESLLLDDEHNGSKTKSRQWLRTAHYRIKAATSVLVVGGGALGVRECKRPTVVTNLPDPSVEFATDIADVYPNKEVTLVHSRDQLLPRFDKWMHDAGTVPL